MSKFANAVGVDAALKLIADKEGMPAKKDRPSKMLDRSQPKVITGWPTGLADKIRSQTKESDFDYFATPMLDAEELARRLEEPVRLHPAVVARHLSE